MMRSVIGEPRSARDREAGLGIGEALWIGYHRLGKAWGESRYDPEARLLRDVTSGGHLPVESLFFARVLLDSREPGEARAGEIVIAALDADALAAAEHGPAAAQAMLELVNWHGERLGRTVTVRVEEALASCAEAEASRRHADAAPGSDSRALLSALALGVGGELLRNDRFFTAGREKLAAIHDRVSATGEFAEYNSPCRAAENLRALSSWLAFTRDGGCRSLAEGLWRIQWRNLLDRAHLPSGQLAGPHGQAMGRDMLRHTGGPVKFYLRRALGPAWPLGREADGTAGDFFPALMVRDPDCPEDLKSGWWSPVEAGPVIDRAIQDRALVWTVETAPGPGGRARKATTYLGRKYCLGTVSVETLTDRRAPVIAHWPKVPLPAGPQVPPLAGPQVPPPGGPQVPPLAGPRQDRHDAANYLAVLALREDEGRLACLPGAVLCTAQSAGRVLGLLRFGLDPAGGLPPPSGSACLAFQINNDASPELIFSGSPRSGSLGLSHGVVLRARGGVLCGIRIIRARVPGRLSEALRVLPAPCAHPEGETGIHLIFGPVVLEPESEAYIAFALEVCEEADGGGIAGLVERLHGARLSREMGDRVRLAWGSSLSLETSTRVLEFGSWRTRQGEVRSGRT